MFSKPIFAASSFLLIAGVGLPAAAAPTNLVFNGDFEASVGGSNGIGQIQQIVALTSWTKTILNDAPTGGFAFVMDSSADGTGYSSIYSGRRLFGPNNPSNPVANSFTGSPNGGKFVGILGDFGRSSISQVVNGLAVGNTYDFSFEFAGAQDSEGNPNVSQDQKWIIGGLGSAHEVGWTNSPKGFTPWSTYRTTIVAQSSSINLSFEPLGSGVEPGSLSAYPVLLLDNVQISEAAPPTPVPGPLPVFGAVAAFHWSRRIRHKLTQSRD